MQAGARTLIKRALSVNPWLYEMAWKLRDLRKPVFRLGGADGNDRRAEPQPRMFDAIYAGNLWDSGESRSGGGSTLAYTEQLRRDLPALMRAHGVTSILDAPCGDLNWMRHVALPADVRYIGGDIVGELIAGLSRTDASAQRRFVQLDITRDELPAADLWLCRDCLFHLPNAGIMACLANFRRSRIKYLLTSTFRFPSRNIDIPHGDFRYINLTIPPFRLPPPLAGIRDFVPPFAPRWLGLWSQEQLAQWSPQPP